jgi:hypothetical protein
MSEAKLPDNVSPALARFADVLCMYNLEMFGPQLGVLLAGPPSRLDERTIMFRLAEHAVRVSAVETLEERDRKGDANILRSLAPITDQATARAARIATDTLPTPSTASPSVTRAALLSSPPVMLVTPVHQRARLSMPPTRWRKPRAVMRIRKRLAESSTKPSIYSRSYAPVRFWPDS